jgi:hypothetical protein
MSEPHLPADHTELTPFEKFQNAFRTVLSVKKEDLQAEIAKEHAKRKPRAKKPKV